MMRIKEAIQRRRLIHEMNEDYKDLERELEISNIKNYGINLNLHTKNCA